MNIDNIFEGIKETVENAGAKLKEGKIRFQKRKKEYILEITDEDSYTYYDTTKKTK